MMVVQSAMSRAVSCSRSTSSRLACTSANIVSNATVVASRSCLSSPGRCRISAMKPRRFRWILVEVSTLKSVANCWDSCMASSKSCTASPGISAARSRSKARTASMSSSCTTHWPTTRSLWKGSAALVVSTLHWSSWGMDSASMRRAACATVSHISGVPLGPNIARSCFSPSTPIRATCSEPWCVQVSISFNTSQSSGDTAVQCASHKRIKAVRAARQVGAPTDAIHCRSSWLSAESWKWMSSNRGMSTPAKTKCQVSWSKDTPP
mmetsp:Transcript_68342/g.182068  ORF Transcript_68342/g.182068 Transcript_68342/m.182068 type:complete len:265 (+) Transcript_68342:426-1220(+)